MRNSRQLLTCLKLTGLCILLAVFSTSIEAQDSVDLNVAFSPHTSCRISCDLEHSGSVLVRPEDPQKPVTTLPLNVTARMTLFQRINGKDQAIRYYEKADAKIKLDKGTTNPTLAESNQLIVARLKSAGGERVEMASIVGTLEQDELDLIQNAADPLTLADVLNKSGVKEGDKWEPNEEALAKMLHVQEIDETNVQLLLKKVDDRSARVYLMGTVVADVDDVTTQMEITGIAIINMNSQMISSFKLGIRETKAPGQITPGFEGKTKIDLRFTPNADSPKLSNSALAKHTKNRKIRQRLKWEPEAANFVVNYEPSWKMIAAEQDAAIFRYIDKGELLTQCNVVRLPDRPANNRLKLDTYKKEVAKIVEDDENARLVSASRVTMPDDKSVLRVTVTGEEEGLDVNWVYYHVAVNDGRQVTFVFTLASSVSSRVTPVADQLVREFLFHPLPAKVKTAKSQTSGSPENKSSRKR